MKCPKCGYLGFEATDRCRNCGYDFSLTVPASSGELPLHASGADPSPVDLSLHDPLFDDGPMAPSAPRLALDEAPAESHGTTTPAPAQDQRDGGAQEFFTAEAAEELPLFAPRPAGPPLAVRRPGTEVPRARRTTTAKPPRFDPPSLPLLVDVPAPNPRAKPSQDGRAALQAPARPMARLAAGLVDVALLASIDLIVVSLTARIAGLALTREDLLVIPPLPMAAFFLVLAFLYLVGFTVGGGQTVGQMALGVKVVGDDQHGVDLTGAVVHSLGTLISVCTLGALFVPVFFTADCRAVYDRLAGTRVVAA
ncbi:MAG: RDD family protein [Acidobacteria bacterium]|nr:RDD family protein [Acidobacteriota bacterium]